MNNNKKDKSQIVCNKRSEWHEQAKFRIINRKWLRYSNKVAFRIIAAMEDIPGMNQKKLAELAGVSPQQVSKILKGQENLTLQSIAKFSEILSVELISFPSFKYNQNKGFEIEVNLNVTLNFLSMHLFTNDLIKFSTDNESAYITPNDTYILTMDQTYSTVI